MTRFTTQGVSLLIRLNRETRRYTSASTPGCDTGPLLPIKLETKKHLSGSEDFNAEYHQQKNKDFRELEGTQSFVVDGAINLRDTCHQVKG